MNPYLQPAEIALIESYLGKNKTVLEWGAGGSTVVFSPLVKHWHSIEHNSQWYAKLAEEIKENKLKNVTLYHVSPEIDLPKRPSKREDYVSYIEKPRQINKKFDVIFIDGRARPECAIEALQHLKKNGVVLIHDFYDKYRPHYKVVLEYYDIVEAIEKRPGIVVLKKKV